MCAVSPCCQGLCIAYVNAIDHKVKAPSPQIGLFSHSVKFPSPLYGRVRISGTLPQKDFNTLVSFGWLLLMPLKSFRTLPLLAETCPCLVSYCCNHMNRPLLHVLKLAPSDGTAPLLSASKAALLLLQHEGIKDAILSRLAICIWACSLNSIKKSRGR